MTSLSATDTDYLYWPEAFGPNQESYVIIQSISAGHPYLSLLLKDTPSDWTQNGYNHRFLAVQYLPGSRKLWIRTVDTCSVDVPCTSILQGREIPIFLAPGDQLGARAHADGTLEVFKNGQLAGSAVIDPAWTPRSGGGRIGIYLVSAPTTRLDAVGGGTLP